MLNNNWMDDSSEIMNRARVTEEHQGIYTVETENGRFLAKVSGKMIYEATGRLDYPAVGDWVTLKPESMLGGDAVIDRILTRKSCFSRKAAGNTSDQQIVAVNVDIVFICMSLNEDFNLNRLDRYMTLAWDSGAIPEVILTKADLCEDVPALLQQVESRAPGVEIHVVTMEDPETAERIRARIKPHCTAAFLGSSGVGKSTLINMLAEKQLMDTGEIRKDDGKGKHITTHRQLIRLPNGGAVIDTPGMREIQLLDSTSGVESTFRDIAEIASGCRFSDCGHDNEPGCAIQTALQSGQLDPDRYESYLKLIREAEFMRRKADPAAASAYRKMIVQRNKAALANMQGKSVRR